MLQLLGEILVLVGVPLYLMSSQTLVFAFRPLLMIVGGLYCLWYLHLHHVTQKTLGLTFHNLAFALTNLLLPSLLVVLGILVLIQFLPDSARLWLIGQDPLSISSFSLRLVLYLVGSAPLQEFIFRAYVTWRLEQAQLSQGWLWFLSVGIFTLLHAPFQSPVLLLVALILGVIYLANFLRYRNLLAVTISHALVGAIILVLRHIYLPYT